MNTVLGLKKQQTQRFLTDGTRIPVTVVEVNDNPVVSMRTSDKHGYFAIQLGYGMRKNSNRAHRKEGKEQKTAPRFLREVRLADDSQADSLPKVGDVLTVSSVLKPGDIIDVTGISKGKGFAGGVKRYGFHGGPKTHGQSDRHRAPGSLGSGTTPGRVYRGKRMAGKMGNEQVTVKNLVVADIEGATLLIKGLVPGSVDNLLVIKKVGEKKNFVPVIKKETKVEVKEVIEEPKEVEAIQEEQK